MEKPEVGVATLYQHTYHTRRQDNGKTGSWRGRTLSALTTQDVRIMEKPEVGVATLYQHTYHTRRQDNGETGS